MSLFEYLAIAFSLVFSFAALRLVSGLAYALDSTRRYYVHLWHMLFVLFAMAVLFWGFWSFRDVQWNFLRFLSVLSSPCLLYFLACTLVPDSASSVGSWREHFYSVRRRYFLGLCFWFVVLSVNTTIMLELPIVHPARGAHLLILAMGAAGAATDRASVQLAIVVAGVVVAALASFVVFLPGSLAA